MSDELWKMTAVEAVARLKAKEISPLELVEASARRIAEVEPAVNAMPTLCLDRARDHAKRVMAGGAACEAAGEAGWLAGLPVSIKDLTNVAGVRTTYGSPIFANHVPAKSHPLVERIERIAASDRWIPESLNLKVALDNSLKDQTYNTPAVATLLMMDSQVKWMNENGGLEGMVERTTESSSILYNWAEGRSETTPFVADADSRSLVVGTIDFDDAVDADVIAKTLRANGVLDTEPYRKLGRNQLRIGMFPAIEPEDIRTLTKAIDYILDAGVASK